MNKINKQEFYDKLDWQPGSPPDSVLDELEPIALQFADRTFDIRGEYNYLSGSCDCCSTDSHSTGRAIAWSYLFSFKDE